MVLKVSLARPAVDGRRFSIDCGVEMLVRASTLKHVPALLGAPPGSTASAFPGGSLNVAGLIQELTHMVQTSGRMAI